jgi:hypothetical protein
VIGGAAARHLLAEPAPSTEAVTLPPETIESLLERRALRYRSGTRLDEGEIGQSGHAIFGVPELLGQRLLGSRRFGVLEFERAHGRSRRTSPGDIVFTTSPPMAAVDHEGGSIVEQPARVLSISNQTRDLVPALLAADINARVPGSARWRDWVVRRVPTDRVPTLTKVTTDLAQLRAATEDRLRALHELHALLADGVVTGSLHHPNLFLPLEPPPVDLDGPAPEGT